MKEVEVAIEVCRADVVVPKYQNLGMRVDVCAAEVQIGAGETVLIPTGLKFAIWGL